MVGQRGSRRPGREAGTRIGRSARLAALAVSLLLVGAAVMLAAPPTAGAQGGAAGSFVSRINGLRASKGLAPLQVDGQLTGLAQDWADHLADIGRLEHASDLSAGVSASWTKLGENVGLGGSVDEVFNAFVNSAPHYANLTDPAFTHVGVGVVERNGVLYTVHRFMAVGGGGGDGGGGSGDGGGSGGDGGRAAPRATSPAPSGSGGSATSPPAPPADVDPAPVDPNVAARAGVQPERVAAVLVALRAADR
jgi:hypothetical protein